ncbi:MAG: hypothetical protein H6811_10065 [Phycisphaeraceae bacterium]|nr:hypothetical protein [Phycisphaeraceae bacterium]
MILRDDHVAAWDAAADSTLERRVYYVQNWRSDVVALTADNGRVLERAWYEPYGVPHGLPAKDLTATISSGADDYGVPNGAADLSDQVYYNTLYGGSSPRADVTGSTTGGDFDYGRPNGTLDSDDSTYWSGLSAQPAMGRKKLSSYTNASDLRNRKGLAGYEWDPAIKKYHVRNRVLDPEIGRWTRRDPLEYSYGPNVYSYVNASPMVMTDQSGLGNCIPGFEEQVFSKPTCMSHDVPVLPPPGDYYENFTFRSGDVTITIAYLFEARQSNTFLVATTEGFTNAHVPAWGIPWIWWHQAIDHPAKAYAELRLRIRCPGANAFPKSTPLDGSGNQIAERKTKWVHVRSEVYMNEREVLAIECHKIVPPPALLEVNTTHKVTFVFRRNVTYSGGGGVRSGPIDANVKIQATYDAGDSLFFQRSFHRWWWCPGCP